MGHALSDLAAKDGSPPLDLQFCEYLNISVCPSSETDTVRWQGERGRGRGRGCALHAILGKKILALTLGCTKPGTKAFISL